MNVKNNGEIHIQLLTNACQNVCSFIKTITVDNISKDDEMSNYKLKVDKLECLSSSLKTQLEQINDLVKQLANSLSITINQDESSIVILNQLLLSLSKKDVQSIKKRKLYYSYSPLKLSLKEKTEENEDSKSIKSMQFEKEKKISSQDNKWKLQIKRDGNPSDLLNKSKQTTLMFQPCKEKMKMDITTFTMSTPKNSNLSAEVLNVKSTDAAINVSQSNLTDSTINSTQIEDTNNISLSHFHKIIKPKINELPIVKTNILESNKINASHDQTENQLCNETFNETSCSPINISMNVLKTATTSINKTKIPNINVLDSFDIIPGLNDKKNDLPNYKFKEDPVRKQNERKLLNGWDCEDCSKFYKANNDNPVEAKTAMNHFSRHRSVKHQHHALTPPGFWDPL
ncbi:uncharacterized protein LOC112682589 [Sipha flava]|jgi:hypothetical protein|uniref:Uncharacterized protein LOC112682589 n=1 Tax=Sipha flava TaxID=143950 RepID=A0A2S2Q3Z8_9HEMI|nr:uncharacterized protein LOC112682589 [Sipha flava]